MNVTPETTDRAISQTDKAGRYGERIKIFILIVLGAVHLLVTWFTIVPGYVSIDEAIYNWTVRDFAATGGFDVWTGYTEFPSQELAHDFLRVHNGRTVSQYPYLYPLIALPLYGGAGYYGLFLVNALFFIGLIGLCFALAMKLFEDRNLALDACLILTLATFSWEYSQAAWPHITSVFFTLAAFHLGVHSYYSTNRTSALLTAFAAGIIAGFAPGIRLDSFLVLPCIILMFLFAKQWRPLEALATIAGTVPGLTALAWTNSVKFGVFNPFSYGTSHTGYTQSIPVPALVVAGALLATAWLLTRGWCRDFLRSGKGRAIGLFLVIVAILASAAVYMAEPRIGKTIRKTVSNGYVAVVDIRALDPAARYPAMSRSRGGGVVYIGGHKKALLQSLPYLAILLLPLGAIVRRREDAPQLTALFLVPAAFILFYAYNPFEHGGLSLNYRFLLPALPFTAILCAYALRAMSRNWGIPFGPVTAGCIVLATSAVYFLMTRELFVTLDELEFPLLVVPLIMACVLAGLVVLGSLPKGGGLKSIRGAAWILLFVALTWSGLMAFFYDYSRHRAQRVGNFASGARILQEVPSDSLFITFPYVDPFMRLIQGDRVRIALPALDRFKDMPKLVAFHLAAGRRVYAAFPTDVWDRLKAGPLESYDVTPTWVFAGGFVGEIKSENKRH